MVFKDSLSGQVLLVYDVVYETNALYLLGIIEIVRRGIAVQSIICDGRKGLFGLFPEIPVQMCQYHQQQIVIRYLTHKPKLRAHKNCYSYTILSPKYLKRNLKRNLPWLFTFETHKSLSIPNTTNALEGSFSNLMRKLNNHQGLTKNVN